MPKKNVAIILRNVIANGVTKMECYNDRLILVKISAK